MGISKTDYVVPGSNSDSAMSDSSSDALYNDPRAGSPEDASAEDVSALARLNTFDKAARLRIFCIPLQRLSTTKTPILQASAVATKLHNLLSLSSECFDPECIVQPPGPQEFARIQKIELVLDVPLFSYRTNPIDRDLSLEKKSSGKKVPASNPTSQDESLINI